MSNDITESSVNTEWITPDDFMDVVRKFWKLGLDVSATDYNHKCDRYITEKQDGLSTDWSIFLGQDEYAWDNPPYGRAIPDWLRKAAIERTVHRVASLHLVPSRTDTLWWWDIVLAQANDVYFLKGRLKFELPPVTIYVPKDRRGEIKSLVDARLDLPIDLPALTPEQYAGLVTRGIKYEQKLWAKVENYYPKSVGSTFPSALIEFKSDLRPPGQKFPAMHWWDWRKFKDT